MRIMITRGTPGSGKSTWVAKNYPGAIVISTDKHHIDPDGVYRFKQERLTEFHDKTLREFVYLTTGELTPGDAGQDLVVDNTNIRVFEIAPYYRIAEAFGHKVQIIQMVCDPVKAAKRNTHGVPENIVIGMHNSIEPLPSWWNVKYVQEASH